MFPVLYYTGFTFQSRVNIENVICFSEIIFFWNFLHFIDSYRKKRLFFRIASFDAISRSNKMRRSNSVQSKVTVAKKELEIRSEFSMLSIKSASAGTFSALTMDTNVSRLMPRCPVSMLLMNVGAFSICSANAIWERPRLLLISPIRSPNVYLLNDINNTSLKSRKYYNEKKNQSVDLV